MNYLGGYDYYMEKKQSLGSGKNYLGELGQKAGGDPGRTVRAMEMEMIPVRKNCPPWKPGAETRKHRRSKNGGEGTGADGILHCGNRGKIEWIQSEMCRERVYTDHEKIALYQSDLNRLKALLAETYEAWIALHD